jgi:hypothetical protein
MCDFPMLTPMKINGKPVAWPWAVVLVIAACSNGGEAPDRSPRDGRAGPDLGAASEAEPATEMTYPVRIGEEGSRFRACGALGRVRGLGGPDLLEVRAAPFRDTKVVGKLANGRSLFICMRSFDQKWFGVVYPEEGKDPSECGVSSPTNVSREYAGSCKSGWVASAFVQLVAE